MMAECRHVVCTAGFESVSEAAWLGKPLFLVPVENHVEQQVNALDAAAVRPRPRRKKFQPGSARRTAGPPAGGKIPHWVPRAGKTFAAIELAVKSAR
jgi:hypothetical protein